MIKTNLFSMLLIFTVAVATGPATAPTATATATKAGAWVCAKTATG
jgi:hypothetical protein